ncbi:hypothetical protein RhiirA1_458311 [Rhizophagus irregularis]|uniref:Uncharacterized protein n=2 Tax=Rhizophagus irregularis TaxID=588596 RepID=A0A2I1EYJ5_9GLOM|nr:hypothetical protein GLOIN_2v1767238 [Rhizophagus irregularis DAOM 181602=DAOM 197198]PKC67539.1 hypothetical protein RhiirA1_458311 [Rhizophagus irregularis]PKY27200.1 hypothetical protein RhiirB3_442813 [Rhizophagus irregularis]POG77918.1 hypothetical protein GLOIN_2v1767238 [Rhizophagus irregularis DAOM 181602=DAOM 197198]GBC46585.2 kinase-like domain-containing protein [Rhizophagus irregularis DAOM 181602=DAOM 197198]|eukprot:XP_025184784.1 hypothetical protein GLOIN_2v1767238 [Rhizophagus irregularis DAOM 181602=DAOM 197198]
MIQEVAKVDKYWVPFERFKNIKEISKGGFAKVYSTRWIDGKALYYDSLHTTLQPFNKPNGHYVPLWIVYITSNYLHSGGWSSLIGLYNNSLQF